MPYTNTNTGSHMPNYSPVERNIINKLKEDNSKLLANVRTLEEENKKLKAEIESSSASFVHGYEKDIKNNPNEDEWRALERENEKLKAENFALRDMVQSLMAKVDLEKQDRIWAEDAEKELIKENEELTEELIRGCAFTEDLEKLKSENENLAYTIRLLRSSP